MAVHGGLMRGLTCLLLVFVATTAFGKSKALKKQGESCSPGECEKGVTCLSYYGIAGAAGPKLSSCEIPCVSNDTKCPEAQSCETVADGPGRVCRPH